MSLTPEHTLNLDNHQAINCLAAVFRGDVIAAGGNDGNLVLWEPSNRQTCIIDLGAPVISMISLSQQTGISLVCGLADGWLVTVECESLKDIPQISHRSAHAGPITAVAYNAKYEVLVTGGQIDGVRLWRCTIGEEKNWLKEACLDDRGEESLGVVQELAFVNDDEDLLVVYVGGTILLLDVASGSPLHRIAVGSPILSSALDLSGTRILLSTADHRWEIRTLVDGKVEASQGIWNRGVVFLGPVQFLSLDVLAISDPTGDLLICRKRRNDYNVEIGDHRGNRTDIPYPGGICFPKFDKIRLVTATTSSAQNQTIIRAWRFHEKSSVFKSELAFAIAICILGCMIAAGTLLVWFRRADWTLLADLFTQTARIGIRTPAKPSGWNTSFQLAQRISYQVPTNSDLQLVHQRLVPSLLSHPFPQPIKLRMSIESEVQTSSARQSLSLPQGSLKASSDDSCTSSSSAWTASKCDERTSENPQCPPEHTRTIKVWRCQSAETPDQTKFEPFRDFLASLSSDPRSYEHYLTVFMTRANSQAPFCAKYVAG
ncbi:WD40 repeat-like protein [Sistotremastrum niveocremeum HHB9708]|uniref:WD40 repeat-like protein n=1 Tax=Sistotremastrum niveocremeum HHB9708 TaxID=1314777 RepID=A0A164WG53_9AGAM|nr:WD40 repeat-like protein [Sistotremastrum niveocremeum HHB9708]